MWHYEVLEVDLSTLLGSSQVLFIVSREAASIVDTRRRSLSIVETLPLSGSPMTLLTLLPSVRLSSGLRRCPGSVPSVCSTFPAISSNRPGLLAGSLKSSSMPYHPSAATANAAKPVQPQPAQPQPVQLHAVQPQPVLPISSVFARLGKVSFVSLPAALDALGQQRDSNCLMIRVNQGQLLCLIFHLFATTTCCK